MKRRNVVHHGMQGLFVFVLLALFAMMSVMLVLFGAQMYRGVVDRMDQNNSDRVLFSYVRSMIKAQDSIGSVKVEDAGGITTLALHENIDGTEYVTWLYEYDGKLYEQFTRADTEMLPDHGVEITEIKAFAPKIEGQLVTVDMMDIAGDMIQVTTALRCSPDADIIEDSAAEDSASAGAGSEDTADEDEFDEKASDEKASDDKVITAAEHAKDAATNAAGAAEENDSSDAAGKGSPNTDDGRGAMT
ncbi:MAG: DUF4860 domain-containing protein [Blautia sp.]|nr:DUF4860 domain-containing protein [Blautia sp.]